jgi:cell division protein FtsW
MCVAALLAFGLVMMTSASIEIASRQYGDELFHFKRQLVYMLMGLACGWAVVSCPMRYWYKSSVALLVLAYVLLVLVLFFGREVNGSTRAFRIGPMSLQASEPAKLAIVVFMPGSSGATANLFAVRGKASPTPSYSSR